LPTGGVVAHFADGTQAKGDVLCAYETEMIDYGFRAVARHSRQ